MAEPELTIKLEVDQGFEVSYNVYVSRYYVRVSIRTRPQRDWALHISKLITTAVRMVAASEGKYPNTPYRVVIEGRDAPGAEANLLRLVEDTWNVESGQRALRMNATAPVGSTISVHSISAPAPTLSVPNTYAPTTTTKKVSPDASKQIGNEAFVANTKLFEELVGYVCREEGNNNSVPGKPSSPISSKGRDSQDDDNLHPDETLAEVMDRRLLAEFGNSPM